MPDCILHTVELPSFDPTTGQLALAQHHLVSAPLSLLNSLPDDLTFLLPPPPARPYQQQNKDDTLADAPPRKKRRRTARPGESSSPADWLVHRQKQERQTTTDRETDEHHAGISLVLDAAVSAVREGWLGGEEKEWMGDLGDRIEWVERERADGKEELDLVELAKRCPRGDDQNSDVLRTEDPQVDLALDRLFDRIVHNPSTTRSSTVNLAGVSGDDSPTLASLFLPPSSAFLLSDFSSWSSPSSGIAAFGAEAGGWDILTIDPPWPNASATRSSSYDTFDAYDLWKLGVPGLLGDKPALVAVWLTNKVKFRRLVLDKLFPAWYIKNAVDWYWIKIASETGEPVVPLEAKHRRCYEGLVLGYYIPPGQKVDLPTLPQNKVFLSTPIGHSRKPVIVDLLRPFLLSPSNPPNILELFARTALSGFSAAPSTTATSAADKDKEKEEQRGVYLAVGNEAVKFNVLDEGKMGKPTLDQFYDKLRSVAPL
ncbi:hypothetical protein JCM8097_005076 [Rhodosporidiobolus ruineniae]